MTITVKIGGRWFGLSTDAMPILGGTLQAGHEFYETDTFIKFFWDGTQWGRKQ